MKNLFFYLLAVLMIGSTFSCEKDSQTNDTPISENAHFSVMLDGAPYVVEDGLRAYAYDLDEHITINGVGDLDATETVTIVLPADFTVGTYSLTPQSDAYAIAIIDGTSYTTHLPGSIGQVNITKYDGELVEGTFEFTAVGGDNFQLELAATEGVFDVKRR